MRILYNEKKKERKKKKDKMINMHCIPTYCLITQEVTNI